MSFALIQREEFPFRSCTQLLYRESSWEIDERVNMIGIYAIDFHVNSFAFGAPIQVLRYARRSHFVK
jgi:hypothetical protein